jgi:hypothetical protein
MCMVDLDLLSRSLKVIDLISISKRADFKRAESKRDELERAALSTLLSLALESVQSAFYRNIKGGKLDFNLHESV